MFHVEPAVGEQASEKGDMVVIDRERDVWLQFVSGYTMRPGTALKLVWQGRVIPLGISRNEQKDEITGETFYLITFKSFGADATAKHYGGILPYKFEDDEEYRQARMLAVEAVLVYGSYYNGDKRPEGYNRFELDGRIYTKKIFGMT